MDVLMPQLGETVVEGTVGNWHKRVGDRVEADEVLLDVETDKVSMEIPAPAAGFVKAILVEAGQTVAVGAVLAVIESAQAVAAPPTVAATPEQQIQVVTSTPPAAEPRHPAPPVAQAAAQPAAAAAQVLPLPTRERGSARLSPAVRRLVAEHGVDAAAVAGTGRNGRITRRDMLAFIDRHESRPRPESAKGSAAAAAAQPHGPAAPQTAGATGVQPFSRVRRLTAEHMVRSKTTSPHVLQAVEVDFIKVEQARGKAREAWRSKRGYSLTYLPFVAKAACAALRKFPNINASVQDDGLLLHTHVNLAIAVDLGAEGLVAPVIHSAEELSVAALAEAIHDVSGRARDGRLRPDDLSGGTYTLSNSGTFGTLITAPIINQPQVAILSVDGVRKRPVVVESPAGDAIAIRPVGILAQSFDHRAFDGAYSAAFLHELRTLLEQTDWSVEI